MSSFFHLSINMDTFLKGIVPAKFVCILFQSFIVDGVFVAHRDALSTIGSYMDIDCESELMFRCSWFCTSIGTTSSINK